MTTYEIVSLVISAAGFVTVIVSVWMLGQQTRILASQTLYVARSLQSNIGELINTQTEAITRLFIEYPELRPYFYAGHDITEDHEHYHRAEAMAELMLDIFLTVSHQIQQTRDTLPSPTPKDGGSWKTYVRDSFAQSPILVRFLSQRPDWYNQELVELMQLGIAHKSTLSAQPTAQVTIHN